MRLSVSVTSHSAQSRSPGCRAGCGSSRVLCAACAPCRLLGVAPSKQLEVRKIGRTHRNDQVPGWHSVCRGWVRVLLVVERVGEGREGQTGLGHGEGQNGIEPLLRVFKVLAARPRASWELSERGPRGTCADTEITTAQQQPAGRASALRAPRV